MVLPQSSLLQTAAFLLSLPSLIQASPSFICSNVTAQNAQWDLKELGGHRAVHWIRDEEPVTKDTTFTIDICKAIGVKKGIPKEDQCPGGTRGRTYPVFARER
jgi:hypothetical protein